MSGLLITLEGGEGAGKSTQASLLAEFLRAKGVNSVVTREPGGTPGAEAVRELLLHGSEDHWSPMTEALLIMAARSDHVERLIRPALAEGRWVICDRFLESTIAYQGGADGIDEETLLRLHDVATGGLRADLTLVLTLDGREAAARADQRDKGRKDRFGGRSANFHQKVEESFRRLAQADPVQRKLVDASGSPDEVASRIAALVQPLLP